jgi:hypothetical protein
LVQKSGQVKSGKSFDPKIVAALKARYVELKEFVKKEKPQARPKLSIDLKVTRGGAPGAGSAVTIKPSAESEDRSGGTSISSNNALERWSVLAMRMHELVHYDAIAIFRQRDSSLTTEFVLGRQMSDLQKMSVNAGSGLVGWVASTGEPIVNGNPLVEDGFINQPDGLCSALSVRIDDGNMRIGVFALYSTVGDAFHVTDLSRIKPYLAEIANVLRIDAARDEATWNTEQSVATRFRPLLQ